VTEVFPLRSWTLAEKDVGGSHEPLEDLEAFGVIHRRLLARARERARSLRLPRSPWSRGLTLEVPIPLIWSRCAAGTSPLRLNAHRSPFGWFASSHLLRSVKPGDFPYTAPYVPPEVTSNDAPAAHKGPGQRCAAGRCGGLRTEQQNPAYRPAHRLPARMPCAPSRIPLFCPMMTRRAKGSGSVREVPEGSGVWRVRVFVGVDPVTRAPRQVERTVKGGRKAAERKRDELAREVQAGVYGEKRGTAQTVGDLLRVWPDHLARIGRRPGTVVGYRAIITNHLIPALGNVELRKLTAFDVDRFYGAQQKAGLQAGTIRVQGAVLSSAISQAIRWGWLGANPCSGATLPQRPETTRRSPGSDNLRRLMDCIGDDEHELAIAVVLAAMTGARRGELCGLRWTDLDRDDATLLIERSRVPVAGHDITGPVKGGKPRRIALGALVLAALDLYERELEDRAILLGIQRDRSGWMVSPDCGRTPIKARWLSDEVTALGKRAGVKVTTHELRHYAATEMVAGGVDVRTAAERLGHTPEMLLRVYAHAMPSRDRAAADLLERAVLALPSVTKEPL
jgi:integrase